MQFLIPLGNQVQAEPPPPRSRGFSFLLSSQAELLSFALPSWRPSFLFASSSCSTSSLHAAHAPCFVFFLTCTPAPTKLLLCPSNLSKLPRSAKAAAWLFLLSHHMLHLRWFLCFLFSCFHTIFKSAPFPFPLSRSFLASSSLPCTASKLPLHTQAALHVHQDMHLPSPCSTSPPHALKLPKAALKLLQKQLWFLSSFLSFSLYK